MVDVDRAARQVGAQALGETVHIARQNDEVDVQEGQQFADLVLGTRLGARRDGNLVVGHGVSRGQFGAVRVVAHDGNDVEGQVARVAAIQQLREAVVVLRDHHQGASSRLLATDRHFRLEEGEGYDDNVTDSVKVI